MKAKFLLFSILLAFIVNPFKGSTQAINQQDSLALADLYNNTNGGSWINHTNWLTAAPVSTWFGITVENQRVTWISLANNKLAGSIPLSLGNLSGLNLLILNYNQLAGKIPASLGNLSSLWSLDLSHNQLSDTPPASLANLPPFTSILLNYNQFTFAGIEFLLSKQIDNHHFLNYFPQADVSLIKNGNLLSVSVGGTPSKNTYQWYNDNVLVLTKTGDSTFSIPSPGNFSVAVSNSSASQLTLYSITSANIQDSLALVDLYNSTNGTGWINHINWLSTAPLGTWYGVTLRKGRVTLLELPANNLTGEIPFSMGSLSNLTNLQLNDNQLSGSIPSSLGSLSSLNGLNFTNNQLSGSLPSTMGNLSNLKFLLLGNNQISGNILSSLGNLADLTDLYLNSNLLNGNIPSSLGNLSNLSALFLNDNQLSGGIPPTLGKLSKLGSLELYNNLLSGNIPDSLCILFNLARLELFNNQLTGNIPDSLGNLSNLISLLLNNNHLSGNIPSLLKLTSLSNLNVGSNAFTFAGMEHLPATRGTLIYSPQASIPITKHENLLTVSVGGTLTNDMFRLFKNGALISSQTGDSVFTITSTGKYSIAVTNSVATQLTLYSDTLTVGVSLADTTITVSQNITGNSATDVNNGIFKLVTLTPTAGANSLSGNVTTTVFVDTSVLTFHNQPYVQRHYDIIPAVNPDNAQATVTLYFTQRDFDNFNAYVTANNLNIPLLPTGGVNNGNVRVIQLHGTFTGSSGPGNYPDSTTVFITPNVVWDDVDNWWAVTFPVSGFSGFFLSTGNFVLPLTLLQFTGELQQNKVTLKWITNDEVNTKQFTIEHRNRNNTFTGIGDIPAQSTSGIHQYSFIDKKPLAGNNFYRIKMISNDGNFSYSYIVPIKIADAIFKLSAYPNPATTVTALSFNTTAASKYMIKVTDQSGKIIKRLNGISANGINEVNINLHNNAKGTYYITLIDEENGQRSLKLNKQ